MICLSDFSSLGLHPSLVRALSEAGYETPTPIQAQAIPYLLQQRDVLGCAQTGTGKTAAFVLPILNRLLQLPPTSGGRVPRVLILSPTRELASQIGESIREYGRYTPYRHQVIFGGVNIRPQINALRAGTDIIVATPGRLLDLHGQGALNLSQIEFFVLDEADRMLDMGFVRDIRRVLQIIPERRQNLLFSATMPKSIADLADTFLHRPVHIEVTPPATTVERIQQSVHFAEKREKTPALIRAIERFNIEKAIVFTRTKHGADKLVRELVNTNIQAAAIHGNKSQNNRERTLAAFRDGSLTLLVATDIASRGIDVDGVSHVFIYDLPNEPDSYVHRIGRTGRAGADGMALAFCSQEERPLLDDILRNTQEAIPLVDIDGNEIGMVDVPVGRGQRAPQPSRRKNAQNLKVDSLHPSTNPRPQRRQDDGPRGPKSDRGSRPSDGAGRATERNESGARRVGASRPEGAREGGVVSEQPSREAGSAEARGPREPRQFVPQKKRGPAGAASGEGRSGRPNERRAGDKPAAAPAAPAKKKRRPRSPDTYRPNVDPNAAPSPDTRFRRDEKK